MGLDVVFENFWIYFNFQIFWQSSYPKLCYRIESVFFFFFFQKKKNWTWDFFRESLTVVFIFYPKLFFMGVIQTFVIELKVDFFLKKKKKIERGVLLEKIWTWFLFFYLKLFIFCFYGKQLNVGFTFLTLSFKFYKLINLRVFWTLKLWNPNRGSLLNNN